MPHLMSSQRENRKEQTILISIWEDAVVSQIHQRDHWTDRWSDWYGDHVVCIWSMMPRPNFWSETCLTSASLPGNKSKTMMMNNAFFKMISFRNGNRCKYGGSRHKSILLARSLIAYADVQPRLEIGIKAERVCDIVTLWQEFSIKQRSIGSNFCRLSSIVVKTDKNFCKNTTFIYISSNSSM